MANEGNDNQKHIYDNYLKANTNNIWCPGCGNGIVLQALIRAIDSLHINTDKVVTVSGIGCSSRGGGYLNLCGMHTTHGRAIAFATGIKLYNPELVVIVLTGDGDCASIGGNHFIHAARRNINLTTIIVNNYNYGMTGGQYSSTTPTGKITKTSVNGNIERPFDMCRIAQSAGATYVARATTYHTNLLQEYISKGISHNGFSVIDVLSDCPTNYGNMNEKGRAKDMILSWKDKKIWKNEGSNMAPQDSTIDCIGEFCENNSIPEYTDCYNKTVIHLRKDDF